jgi:hypothetical protein
MMKKFIILLLVVIGGYRIILGDPEAPYYNQQPKKQKHVVSDNVINNTVGDYKFKDSLKGDSKIR